MIESNIHAITEAAMLLLVLTGLAFTVIIDSYIKRIHRGIMLVVIALCLSLVAQNLFENYLAMGAARPMLRTGAAVYGSCVRPVFLVLFLYFIQPERKHWNGWLLVGLNAAVYMTAFFSNVCFMITPDNHYISGPLADTALYISALLLANLFYQTVREARMAWTHEKWILLHNFAVVIICVVMDESIHFEGQPITFLTIAIVVSSLFYYIWLHLQFVRQHERALQAEQRIQIMMTQIQPHFLYNTIATFRALCKKDPEKAAQVADKFGRYLRQNLDTLDATGLIAFDRELEHTRLYADIEMVRFENIQVSYDIRDREFSLPPLTIQPIVENAIRHGVRIRETGIVRVSTYCEPHFHVIVVEDNGIGFDTEGEVKSGGRHIGIRNVRERVESMCGGFLELESMIGEGTTVTIRIPM